MKWNYDFLYKTREDFLNYVWVYCIEPQLGYSFSINHTVPYSVVAVQEANLATRWNPLYWQCACLCVNSGNYVGEIGEDEEDEDIEEIQEEVEDEQIKGLLLTAFTVNYLDKAYDEV